MLKKRGNGLVLLLLVFTLFTCIDPYTPQLKGYDSVLVVEGMITNDDGPSEIILSRSVQGRDSVPEMVTDATVRITDDLGNVTILNNCGGGLYKTDPAAFTGEVGKTYTLHISTIDGREYISDASTMLPVPDIDSVYYGRDEIISIDRTEIQEGLRLYADVEKTDNENSYLRWEIEETWKFGLPSPKRYVYLSETLPVPAVPVDTIKEFCWKSHTSDEIITRSVFPGQAGITMEPLLFIAASKSDRLLIRYSALVRQYSISRKEFDFWNNLRKANETGGDIFDSQPWAVVSNIKNVDDPGEKILGYFKVSAVKTKRIYITSGDIADLNLGLYRYDCQPIVKEPRDYPPPNPFAPPVTWDGLAEMYESDPRFVFVEPIYEQNTTILRKLVFAKVGCSDCELTGTLKKPEFWIE